MVLKPGESTQIESSVFMMHPGMDGKHDYAVHLKTNDPNKPDLVVHVLSDWGPCDVKTNKTAVKLFTAVLFAERLKKLSKEVAVVIADQQKSGIKPELPLSYPAISM